MNLFKNSQTNWKYILIVVILAAIVGGGILWWMMKPEVPSTEFPKVEKKKKEALGVQEIILSDKEVLEILKEFAGKKSAIEKPEIGYNEILLDALEFKNENIKERLEKVEGDLKKWGEVLEDAPDMRSFARANTKTCIAKSIIYNDLKHTCNIKEDSTVSLTGVDDILAVDEILPYFISGFAYYVEGDFSKADYYFKQVKTHRQVGIKQWEESYFLEVAGLIYEKIYNKTMKLSPEEIILEDWIAYKNDKYGFEMKYPILWVATDEVDPSSRGGFLKTFRSDEEFALQVNGKEFLEDVCIIPECSTEETVTISGIETTKFIWAFIGRKGGIACREWEQARKEMTEIKCEELLLDSETEFYNLIEAKISRGRNIYTLSLNCTFTKFVKEWMGGRNECNQLFNQISSTFRFSE